MFWNTLKNVGKFNQFIYSRCYGVPLFSLTYKVIIVFAHQMSQAYRCSCENTQYYVFFIFLDIYEFDDVPLYTPVEITTVNSNILNIT